jgi:hypothetical protein
MTEEQQPTGVPEATVLGEAAQLPLPAGQPVVVVDAGAPMVAPYRLLPPEEALAPVGVRASSRYVPVLAPALWMFGVLLWSFVAMGALTTLNGPGGRGPFVEEGLAVAFVVVATLGALVVGIRRSLGVAPTRGTVGTLVRGVVVALLATPAWLIVTMITAAVGRASTKNLDAPITITLLCLAGACVLTARKLLGTGAGGGATTAQQRVIAGALWTVAVVVTLGAFVGTVAGD